MGESPQGALGRVWRGRSPRQACASITGRRGGCARGRLGGTRAPPPPPRRRGGWQVARTAARSAAPRTPALARGRERRRRRELGPSATVARSTRGRTTAHLLHIITGVVSLWPRANDTSPIQAVVESARMHVRTGRRRPLGRPARRQKIHTAHAWEAGHAAGHDGSNQEGPRPEGADVEGRLPCCAIPYR